MSYEELKIRSELEMDVERDLEEEIKDGIYHLALRLHRLYQHQKERNDQENQGTKKKNDKSILEVNINIRMEGGTKIEIKEMVKKEADHQENGRRPRTSSSNRSMQEIVTSKRKKFDWASTLRSGTTGDDHILHYKPKYLIKKDHIGTNENVRVDQGDVGKRKGNVSIRRSEERELGWKD